MKICRGILIAYFLMMAVIYPFYAPGGYLQIGEVKYRFFRDATLILIVAVGVITLLSILKCRDREWIIKRYRRMSVTDWFAYGYCLVIMISYLCSEYKEDALWGAEGWYMGAMSQIMFVLLYFLFSRHFCRYSVTCEAAGALVEKGLGAWLVAAAGVFLLGICNRYSLYPIAMEGQTETFISTLGNINWFCGYWSVTAPLGVIFYWCSEKKAVRILLGIYTLIAVLSGITQGSSSAYLVFIALFISLFLLSLQSSQKLYRFLELCMLFAIACQVGRFMQYLPGLSYNYWGSQTDAGSGITALLLTDSVTVWVFLFAAACYALLRILERRGRFCIEQYKWIRGVMTAVVAAVAIIGILLLMIDSGIVRFHEVPGTIEEDGYLEAVLDEDWGNGRGATWNCGVDAYKSMDPIHKIVGIGPDCFADYIYDVPELGERMSERFGNLRLTNAHNEWITVLVNTGASGLICYVGIFLSAFVQYLKRANKQPLLYVFAVTLLTYAAHDMVSFQQVLNTPYIFIVLGIGEGLRRSTVVRTDLC